MCPHKHTHLLLLAACLLSTAASAATPATLADWLKSKNALAERSTATRQSREMTYLALANLVGNGDPALAEHDLHLAYDTQVMSPTHGDFGQLAWIISDKSPITDYNAIEFNSLPLGSLLTRYHDKLSPNFLT